MMSSINWTHVGENWTHCPRNWTHSAGKLTHRAQNWTHRPDRVDTSPSSRRPRSPRPEPVEGVSRLLQSPRMPTSVRGEPGRRLRRTVSNHTSRHLSHSGIPPFLPSRSSFPPPLLPVVIIPCTLEALYPRPSSRTSMLARLVQLLAVAATRRPRLFLTLGRGRSQTGIIRPRRRRPIPAPRRRPQPPERLAAVAAFPADQLAG